MRIEEYQDVYENAWDAYCERHSQGTFFHKIGWKQLIERVYGYKPIYLMAINGDDIIGVLPLFYVQHWALGKKLISIPFAVYGGLCTDTTEAGNLLLDHAINLSKGLNVEYMELRHITPFAGSRLQTNQTYFTFHVNLDTDSEKVFQNIRRDSRRCIRRGLEQNFEIEMDSDDILDFYKIYARGQRDLGTPVISRHYVESIFNQFPDVHTIARIRHQGKTIASLLVREYKDTISPTIGYALKEYKKQFPLYVLYWKLIEKGCQKGFRYFDFGRSIRESGTFKFKEWWGAEPIPLHYQYFLLNNKLPDTSQRSSSRKQLAKLWKKLPVPIANLLGPAIRKHYP